MSEFLAISNADIIGALALAQMRHFRVNEAQQIRAWDATIAMLRPALAALPEAAGWRVLLEYPMLRLGRRPDVILLTSTAIIIIEIKAGATVHALAGRRQVEDYALDLQDFHTGCRSNPIVPILLAEHAPVTRAAMPLLLSHGVAAPLDANAESLTGLLRDLHDRLEQVASPLDAGAWLGAPYCPVPTIVDAACMALCEARRRRHPSRPQ